LVELIEHPGCAGEASTSGEQVADPVAQELVQRAAGQVDGYLFAEFAELLEADAGGGGGVG
jgi:hypothetical protein